MCSRASGYESIISSKGQGGNDQQCNMQEYCMLKVISVLLLIWKHPAKTALVYNFLMMEITCWFLNFSRVFVKRQKLDFDELIIMSRSSSKPGGCAGALSRTKRHLRGKLFSSRYIFAAEANTSVNYSIIGILVTQALVLDLQITGSLALCTLFLFKTCITQ